MLGVTTYHETLLDLVRKEITDELAPYRAAVVAISDGKVQVQEYGDPTASSVYIPRLAGFDMSPGDVVWIIGRKNPTVLERIWTSQPATVNLTSALNVTGLISGGIPQQAFFLVPGFVADTATAVTTPTSNQIIAQYLGVAPRALTSITVRVNVTTQVSASPTWAEIGIAKGTPTMGSGASLTRIGYTNVASTFNSTGLKDTVVSVTAAAGDHLWVLWGSQAATPYVLRGGGIGDALSTGRNQFVAATRISTMSANTAFGVTSGSANDAWIAAAW